MSIWLILFGVIGAVLLGVWQYRPRWPSQSNPGPSSHMGNIERSYQLLETINTIAQEGSWPRALAYLRKIDVYLFEELLLTTLEQKYGALILRNHTYSGDGGVDGGFILFGEKYFVQAKRYKGFVRKMDVEQFNRLLEHHNIALGLFVHTGKTPHAVWRHYPRVMILSGERLIRFLTGKESRLLY